MHYLTPVDDLDATCLETWAELRLRTPDRSGSTETLLSSRGKVDSRDLRTHLDWLLGEIADRSQISAELRRSPSRAEVFCPWLGDGGPTIWPAQVRAIAALGLDLALDYTYVDVFSNEAPGD